MRALDGAPASVEQFFAPVPRAEIGGLFKQYQAIRERITEISASIDEQTGAAVDYFITAARSRATHFFPSPSELFALDPAIAALNAEFWRRAMELTDVYNCMPQSERDKWDAAIKEMKTPEFEEETVRATIENLLDSRERFFCDRVDGIFRALSHEHVTNSPRGFNKRMILYYAEYSSYSITQVGHINDLRCVIARFMGRDEPRWNTTSDDLRICKKNTGAWHSFDGGAIRMRVYLKGTCHLEVHPEMSWRLNQVLHSLYPAAIPDSERRAPGKSRRRPSIMERPLPFSVINYIRDFGKRWTKEEGLYSKHLYRSMDSVSKQVFREAIEAMEALGGTYLGNCDNGTLSFDVDPEEAIDELLLSGCLPDQKSHQFYPTPEAIAQHALWMADINEDHTCLEPSAGTGALAGLLRADHTFCVEISPLHCKLLEARGLKAHCGDFLEWADSSRREFDRVVMNPPYCEGQWYEHLQAGAKCVKPGGRLVAVLPASARGKDLIDGWGHDWSRTFSGEFKGTSASVAVLCAIRPEVATQ